MTKSALIVSYAEIEKDPRVRNQILWLVEDGYLVNTLGRGAAPATINGKHWRIERWPLVLRLLAYIFLPRQVRFNFLMGFWIKKNFTQLSDERFDLVVLNTIDYLPWGTKSKDVLVKNSGQILLDLHEYSASQGIGLTWKLLFMRYQMWLTTFIGSSSIDKRITVSQGIADLYRINFEVETPQVIRNVPPFVELSPSTIDPKKIQLIHHGKADIVRGLPLILEALPHLNPRFEITFMLVGSPKDIFQLKTKAQSLGVSHRVTFREPVSMSEVASTLNDYDAEIIFFPPETENLRLVLPNKYFEAIQGRLAIITGPSPEITSTSKPYSNAVSTQGWKSSDLIETINSLTVEDLTKMKSGSDKAASEINLATEGAKFIEYVNK